MKTVGLWGEDIVLDSPKEKIINKSKKPKKVSTSKETLIKSKKLSISDKLAIINENVKNTLGVYKDTTIVIKSKQELSDYIDKSIDNGIIAIDTETNNSLDPLTCKLMGLCLYTPGLNSAYIPVNHTDLQGNKFEWQVTEDDIQEQLLRLSSVKILMHNGKFDYQVLYCTCGVKLDIYWDSMVAAKVLDENEKSAGLKQQYIDKIDSSIEKYSIDKLFESIEYKYVDPEIFALYAATDSYMTYKLYEYQFKELSKSENNRLLDLLFTVEIPIVTVSADMELTGICIDKEYSNRLSKKYHDKYDNLQILISEELHKYDEQISKWRTTPEANVHEIKNGKEQKSLSEKLKTPVEVTSPTQLAILLYDVLKVKPVSTKSPRGTGEDILKKIDLPICDLILQQRGLLKLINTYIDKLPECVSEYDGRLHTHFNQYGAQTGRFSSSEPNLQNIPSHENSIRMMFVASEGNTLIGSDFSQQEPRILSHFANDTNMINAYKEGKDLYAMIASKVYHNNYEDNKEFRPDGTMNPDGKKRRSSCKSLLLGIMYGMGTASIATAIKSTIEEADKIKRGFFEEFPNVEKWINTTIADAHINGYVEDVWGRRRRLPDIFLDKYEISSTNISYTFNPLLNSSGIFDKDFENKKYNYLNKLNNCKYRRDVDTVKQQMANDGLKVKDNTGFISQAERQCVNARIQGSAATMSKRAMILVHKNEELKKLGFKLLIAVHDELIGECPIENKDRCKELLSQLMIDSAKPEVQVPMKCDADDFHAWYEDVYSSEVKKEYNQLKNDMTEEEAFISLCKSHCECSSDQLKRYIDEI